MKIKLNLLMKEGEKEREIKVKNKKIKGWEMK